MSYSESHAICGALDELARCRDQAPVEDWAFWLDMMSQYRWTILRIAKKNAKTLQNALTAPSISR